VKLKISGQQLERLIPVALVLLAIFLRFYNFESKVIFYGDHSRDFLTTLKIIKYHEIVWHGPAASVTWHLLSPIYYYLLLPFYLVSGWHPLTQPVVTGVLGVVTTLLIYFSAKNFWGQKAALVASLIYACSVLIIPDNLLGLNPGLVPPATVLLTWSFIKVLNGESRYLPLAAGCLAWIISFHASAFFLIPPLVTLYVLKKTKVTGRDFWLATSVFFAIAITPYGIQEKKHGGYNLITTYNYFFSKDVTAKALQEYVPFKNSLINYGTIFFKTPQELLFPGIGKLATAVSISLWLLITYTIIKFWKRLDSKFKYLCLLFLLYSLFFGVAVRFRTPSRPNWWFGNVFFPLLIINLGYLASLLRNKIILGVLIVAVVSFNYVELQKFESSTNLGKYDLEKKMIANILSDAGNSNFRLKYYYQNIEESGAIGPLVYLCWYFDRPKAQEKYFSYLNWNKEPASNLTYVIFQNSSPNVKAQVIGNQESQLVTAGSGNYEIVKVLTSEPTFK